MNTSTGRSAQQALVKSASHVPVLLRIIAGALLLFASDARGTSPSFTLDPPSPTLPLIIAGPADVLVPAVPPAPGPLPAPVIGIPAAALGLVPGDVVTGLSYGLAPLGPFPGLGVFFSVDGAAIGFPAPAPPNLFCEAGAGQGAVDVYLSQPFGPPLALPNILALD